MMGPRILVYMHSCTKKHHIWFAYISSPAKNQSDLTYHQWFSKKFKTDPAQHRFSVQTEIPKTYTFLTYLPPNKILTLKNKINVHVVDFVNRIKSDDMAHNQLPHQGLQCFPSSPCILNMIKLGQNVIEILNLAHINFVICSSAL